MSLFNIYRPLGNTHQLLAKIKADDLDMATRRAMHHGSFVTWDGKPGVIFHVDDPENPEKLSPSKFEIKTLDGSFEKIIKLEDARKQIELELNRHHSSMSSLNDTYRKLIEG